jgi:hypothetical protein
VPASTARVGVGACAGACEGVVLAVGPPVGGEDAAGGASGFGAGGSVPTAGDALSGGGGALSGGGGALSVGGVLAAGGGVLAVVAASPGPVPGAALGGAAPVEEAGSWVVSAVTWVTCVGGGGATGGLLSVGAGTGAIGALAVGAVGFVSADALGAWRAVTAAAG